MSDDILKVKDAETTYLMSNTKSADGNANTAQAPELISIENFDENSQREPILTSPRSLRACEDAGIQPIHLVKRTRAEIKSMFKNRVQMTEDAVDLFMQHFEERRKQKVQTVKDQRQKIIEAGFGDFYIASQDLNRTGPESTHRPGTSSTLNRSNTFTGLRYTRSLGTGQQQTLQQNFVKPTQVQTAVDESNSKINMKNSLFGGHSQMSVLNTSMSIEKAKRQESREIELMIQKELDLQKKLEKDRQQHESLTRQLQQLQQYRDQRREQKYKRYSDKADQIAQLRQRQESLASLRAETLVTQMSEYEKNDQMRQSYRQQEWDQLKQRRSFKHQKTIEASNRIFEEDQTRKESKVLSVQAKQRQIEELRKQQMQEIQAIAMEKQRRQREAYERAQTETAKTEAQIKQMYDKRAQKAFEQVTVVDQIKNNFMLEQQLKKRQKQEVQKQNHSRVMQDWQTRVVTQVNDKNAKSTRHLSEFENQRKSYYTKHKQNYFLKKITSEDILEQKESQYQAAVRRIEERMLQDELRLNAMRQERKMALYEKEQQQRKILIEKHNIKYQLEQTFQKNKFPDLKRLQTDYNLTLRIQSPLSDFKSVQGQQTPGTHTATVQDQSPIAPNWVKHGDHYHPPNTVVHARNTTNHAHASEAK